MKAMGRLFERLAAVAKDNPLATRRKGYSAEELSTISDDNRWICFPYPRLMNANAIIDQAAAILVTSVGKAREFGIPQERWVFLHGCADGTDTWVVSERERLDTSPAIKAVRASPLIWPARRFPTCRPSIFTAASLQLSKSP
jgi:acetyl-CoA C-acetyltransferase